MDERQRGEGEAGEQADHFGWFICGAPRHSRWLSVGAEELNSGSEGPLVALQGLPAELLPTSLMNALAGCERSMLREEFTRRVLQCSTPSDQDVALALRPEFHPLVGVGLGVEVGIEGTNSERRKQFASRNMFASSFSIDIEGHAAPDSLLERIALLAELGQGETSA